jgi:Tfp pilus assembly protein PilZ
MDFFFNKKFREDDEGRLKKRIDILIKVRFTVEATADSYTEKDTDTHIGTIRSLTPDGMELESRHIFPVRTVLHFEFNEDHLPKLTFEGVVRTVKKATTTVAPRPRGGKAVAFAEKRAGRNPGPRFSRMSIEFFQLTDSFKSFINTMISQHQKLDKKDPYYDALVVQFNEPEDLYWEFHVNISKNRLYVTTPIHYEEGEKIRIQIKVRPTMEIIRVIGKVLKKQQNIHSGEAGTGILVQILKYEQGDKEKLFTYAKYVDSIIDRPDELEKERQKNRPKDA